MIEKDTIRLLRECDAGIQMGIQSLSEVIPSVTSAEFKAALTKSRNDHEVLLTSIHAALDRFGDEGKKPHPIAQGMSWMETNVKLTLHEADCTVADLIYDGCNMGVKSLSKYLNQYKAADEQSKNLAKKLITIERDLAENASAYL